MTKLDLDFTKTTHFMTVKPRMNCGGGGFEVRRAGAELDNVLMYLAYTPG